MSVEPFVRKSDKPADEPPCALGKVSLQIQLYCQCQAVPTLLVLVGPDHVARCPYCTHEYFLSFLFFDCDKGANVGVQLRWREASGIVPATTTLPPVI